MRFRLPTVASIAAAAVVATLLTGCSHRDVGDRALPSPTVADGSTMARAGGSASSSGSAAQDGLDSALREAAWADNVTEARRLIDSGADVNAKDDTVQSAYLIATSEGYLDLLHLTLEHGAIVNDKDSWNGTGLIRAAERGHADVVGALLRAGIDRDHVNRIGYQAIHEAVTFGRDTASYQTTVRALVAGGVEFDRPSGSEGLTPLQMAQQEGFETVAHTLTSAGAESPTDPDAALLHAARDGDADAATVAIRAVTMRTGADIAAIDLRPALAEATARGHEDVARLLVALGADAR